MGQAIRKKNWDTAKCDKCEYRFQCFTDNQVDISPVKVDETFKEYTAEFNVPKCVRLGLLKRLNDVDYMNVAVYPHATLDEKYGYVWVRFPNTLMVNGFIENKNC